VFKTIPNDPKEHACCAAQMFLNEGDAVVFRGANGPWKTGDFEFHLKAPEAKKLVSRVLETFKDKHGVPPKEFFIHGRTTFTDDEWGAFQEAAPAGTNIIGVRIKTTKGDVKLFRDGDYPVMRGTALLLDDRNAYLWTNGFVPRLDTYIGPETPNPLFITVLRSTGEPPDIKTVLADIMGLTKINYNACNYSDGLPVTVRFANKVGDVLTMRSAKDAERQPLKFYV
jgi:signal peptidase I